MVLEVERRREWVGEGPISSPNEGWYWRIVSWSVGVVDTLGRVSEGR